MSMEMCVDDDVDEVTSSLHQVSRGNKFKRDDDRNKVLKDVIFGYCYLMYLYFLFGSFQVSKCC